MIVVFIFFSDHVVINGIQYNDGDIMCKDANIVYVFCSMRLFYEKHIVCGKSHGDHGYGYSDGQTCSCTWKQDLSTYNITTTVTMCQSGESY